MHVQMVYYLEETQDKHIADRDKFLGFDERSNRFDEVPRLLKQSMDDFVSSNIT